MVQVINLRPGADRRQRALEKAQEGIIGALSTYAKFDEAQKQKEARERALERQSGQQAVQFSAGLAREGIELSPEEQKTVSQAFQAGEFEKLQPLIAYKASGVIEKQQAAREEAVKPFLETKEGAAFMQKEQIKAQSKIEAEKRAEQRQIEKERRAAKRLAAQQSKKNQ